MTPASRDDERLATIFKAMGHPLRLRLLRDVVRGELCVSELGRQAESAQATISQHLAILRDRGLVIPERRGNMTCYRLADKRIADLIRRASQLFELHGEAEAAGAQTTARR
jgi:DNA-binding transcriptional ArsR family regulator